MEPVVSSNVTLTSELSSTVAPSINITYLRSRNRTSSAGQEEEITLARQILNAFNLYYLGFILIVGILGNLKNVLVFLCSRNRLRSPSYYLAALALADVVFLVTLLILWISHFGANLFSWNGVYQTLYYLSSTSSCISGKLKNTHFF